MTISFEEVDDGDAGITKILQELDASDVTTDEVSGCE